MQPKLLRVLEERVVRRVGGPKPRRIDLRFVTATRRDLLAEVRAGRFRSDLYYRISGLSVRIPPLRERPSELEPLARHFVQQFARAGNERAPELTPAALAALALHDWPGNVRELENVIQRAALVANGGAIGAEHILLDQATAPSPGDSGAWEVPHNVDDAAELMPERGRDGAERARVIAALDACAGNQRRAAELLGISRRTLVNWLNKWNLPRPKKMPEQP
jgi:DNA-binding NtrC family response regulator